MDNIILQKTWVQGCPVIVDNLLGTAFTGEAQAHTFVVSGVDAAQEPVTITGTITGKFLAANNVTVPLTGSLVNGAASVTLTDECYDVPGRYILSIYATNGSTTQCLYCAVGNVFRTDSQTIAYPSTDLPNITTLMAQLEEILDGWPADYSQLQNDVSDLKSAVSTLDEDVLSQETTFCTLANGTLSNPNNANAVNTTAIPCANGDTVTIVPVRPNTDGYYYQYAYRVYNASNTILIDISTADAGNNGICINAENAAYIRFAIFEYNGTSYNPLRIATYGYTPYATVVSGEGVKTRTDSLYTNIELPVTLEVGVNRYLDGDGKIVVSSHTRRASTVPTQIQYKSFEVVCNSFYKWNMFASEDGIVYSEIETSITGNKTVTINPGDYVFFQIFYTDGNYTQPMADGANDFHLIVRNLSEELSSIISSTRDDAMKKYGAGIANGSISSASNANAINTTTYIPVGMGNVAECHIDRPVDADGYYYVFAWRLYGADKTTVVSDNYTALLSNKVFTVSDENSKYIRFAIFQTNGSGDFIPLRTSNVNAEDVYITVKKFDVMALHENEKPKAKVIKLKKTDNENYGECDAKFMFVTDVHKESVRLARTVDLTNGWGLDFASAVINGGDTVQSKITESLDWYYDETDRLDVPLLNTVGNHDAWTAYNELASATTVYEKIIAPIVANSGIVQPSGASANGYNYYYKDFGTLRVIVLDCMFWDATQLSWFESILADAKTNGKHVLCVTHAAFPWANMETVDCLWSKAGLLTGYSDSGAINDPTRTPIAAAGAVKTFIDGGGKFVCWLTGHQHGDDLHKLPDYNNQMVVTMGSFAQRASMLQKSDDQADYNYDCITYIAVDCTNKCIKFLRIGADIDMYGVKHDGLSIRYDRTEPIVTAW